jgi:hypothetical protein
MKKLIILTLFIPFFSFAQRFEISELAGYSTTNSLTNSGSTMSGFSNQVSIGYRCLRHFSVSAYYQFNSWNDHNNAYGISPDFVTKHFYAGLDLQRATFSPITDSYISFNTSWGYGLHIGSRQRIFKGLSCVEQLGYDLDNVTANTENNLYPIAVVHQKSTETLNIWYLSAGISYRI